MTVWFIWFRFLVSIIPRTTWGRKSDQFLNLLKTMQAPWTFPLCRACLYVFSNNKYIDNDKDSLLLEKETHTVVFCDRQFGHLSILLQLRMRKNESGNRAKVATFARFYSFSILRETGTNLVLNKEKRSDEIRSIPVSCGSRYGR